MIVSRRAVFRFYFLMYFMFLSYGAIATAMLIIAVKNFDPLLLRFADYFAFIFCGIVYFIAFYTIYRFCKNVPIIRIDNSVISFNREAFLLTEISHISFTGKRKFTYLLDSQFMEAATLTFNNGKIKYIFDDMYKNAGDMKLFLQQVVINKKEFVKPSSQKNINFTDFDCEVYDGKQITSMKGIFLWAILAMLAYVIFGKTRISAGNIIALSLISLYWFIFFSWMMNYFKISQEYLTIKKHNLFWIMKIYKIADIQEIVFEQQGRLPNSMRVTTKDFESKVYAASTLRNKTWLAMKDKWENLGISVRNECIPLHSIWE